MISDTKTDFTYCLLGVLPENRNAKQAAFWAPELWNTLEIMYTVYATAVKKHNCPLQEDGLCSSVFIWMNEILHVRTVLESQRGGWVGQA